MSLNFQLGGIADWESVTQIEALDDAPMQGVTKGDMIQNPVTTSLIWSTIAVGLGEISESNAEKFYGRLRCYEKLFGAFMYRAEGHVGDPWITPEEVIQHIGLTTNVSDESDTKWRTRILSHFMGEQARPFRRASEKLDKEKVAAKLSA